MNSADMARMKVLAEAATQGPWRNGTFPKECAGPGDVVTTSDYGNGAYTILSGNSNFPDDAKANAAHAAASNPSAVIELINDLSAARALLAEVLNMHESSEIYTTSWDMTVDTDEFLALTKRIDALLKGAA